MFCTFNARAADKMTRIDISDFHLLGALKNVFGGIQPDQPALAAPPHWPPDDDGRSHDGDDIDFLGKKREGEMRREGE